MQKITEKNLSLTTIKLISFLLTKAFFQEQDYITAAENWLYDRSDLPQVPGQTLAPIFKELLEEQLVEEFINNPEKYFKPDTKLKLINNINQYLAAANEQQKLYQLPSL